MTQSTPPNDPRRDRPAASPNTGPSRPLSFDEMIALVVAFLSLGSVLFWGLTRTGLNLFDDALVSANGALTAPEQASEGRSQLFSLGTESETEETPVTASDKDTEAETEDPTGLSAREQLAAQAADEQEAANNPNLLDNIKAGVAGAAAGITGVATSPAPGTAAPSTVGEEEVDPEAAPEAAESTPAPSGISLSESATSTPEEAVSFRDVPDNYWAKPYIDALSSRGLISGFAEGDFQPEQPVTRAQIATVVANTFDLTADKENLDFSDVQDDYWAKESIGEVVKGGFMTGFPNDTFDPNAPVTRAQAFTTLVTGLNTKTPTNVQTALSRYTDSGDIPQWANEKIAAATGSGFVVNYPNLNQLNPNEATTRAELAAMIYQALAKEGAVEPIESEYVVKP